MTELRRACFERDGYRCTALVGKFRCNRMLAFDSEEALEKGIEVGQLAHIKGKRMHGDSLENTRLLCFMHHHFEHVYGKDFVKPVPRKEAA